jgi:hypothetical protein
MSAVANHLRMRACVVHVRSGAGPASHSVTGRGVFW